ncbi:MAG TPA: RecQ family ATP-dependent DNA helicase [Clostridiaceae bacterium]|nr:RecQ family ATP-dependent DNA helicase [Clostridiaceae bacterium]
MTPIENIMEKVRKMEINEVLDRYFGFRKFKKEQLMLIRSIMEGRDSFGILPTGYGKSLCYQIPALSMPGVTLVISPLISLMKDQVDALRDRGVAATFINSSLDLQESNRRKGDIRKGLYKIIYVSPESLKKKRFGDLLRECGIVHVVVDEAHCISIWGHDFRPSYLEISNFIDSLEKRPVVSAFTATATNAVRKDIRKLLKLEDPLVVIGNLDRENLCFKVMEAGKEKEDIVRLLSERKGMQGIIYCQRIKEAQMVSAYLAEEGFLTGLYHGGMEDGERRRVQEDFSYDRLNIMVATSAFGMGIDKSNIRYVLHLGIPKDIESYYQEAGRAGRDNSPGECILLYRKGDAARLRGLISRSELSEERKAVELWKLSRMDAYGRYRGCLRSYILEYFHTGDDLSDMTAPSTPVYQVANGAEEGGRSGKCLNCSNCIPDGVVNLTIVGKKMLSAVARLEDLASVKRVISVLLGEETYDRKSREFQNLSVYGILAGEKRTYLEALVAHMEQEGFVRKKDHIGRECLELTDKGRDLLRGRESLLLEKEGITGTQEEHTELFTELRKLRTEISYAENKAPYIIFHDATLKEIIKAMPRTLTEFRNVRGVGEAKAIRYGRLFLDRMEGFRKGEPVPKPTFDYWAIPEEEMEGSFYGLYKKGLSLQEIADRKGVVIGTVVENLLKNHRGGMDVDLTDLFQKEKESAILEAIAACGMERTKPIRDYLMERGISVEYLDIKVAVYKNFDVLKK